MSHPSEVVIPFRGDSMWPTLMSGDMVRTRMYSTPRKMSQCELGSIVLHREGEEWVIHRVIEWKGRKVLKGDFSNSYFFEKEPVVWGELAGINRDGQQVLKPRWNFLNKWISQLSRSNIESPPLRRKCNKLLIFLLSRWKWQS